MGQRQKARRHVRRTAHWHQGHFGFRVGHHAVDIVHELLEFGTVALAWACQVHAHLTTHLAWVRTEDHHAVGQPNRFFNIMGHDQNAVLIHYYFDYEAARIWRSEALEMSRHDR